MKDLTTDSRMVLLMMAADGVVATGGVLAEFWRRLRRPGRVAQHLRNLTASGLIDAEGTSPLDERLFHLTERGWRSVWGEIEPEALWSRAWDGKWRMAMFDVPQAHAALRVRLRRHLRKHRFGWLQNSVWLSPDPVSQLVQQLGPEAATVESLLFMEGRPAGGETDAALVRGAWNFPRLEKLHTDYVKLLRLRPTAGGSVRRSEWSAWLMTEQRAWREIVRHDPLLPEALWPREYKGRMVWQARIEALQACGQALALPATEAQ